MGTLTLTNVAANQAAFGERISFNPCRLPPGIEPSDDPILEPAATLMRSRVNCAAARHAPSTGVEPMPGDGAGWIDL